MNAVIYARYSSSSQDAQTIEVQIGKCLEYAKKKGLNIINEYIDEAKSGRTDNRPQFKKMLEDSKNGNFQYIIVYKLDRFARSMQVSINSQALLEENNVEVLSTCEELLQNASGRFMKGIYQLVAQFYSDDYAERISNGLANNASKFLTTGNNVPLGLVANKETKALEINDETAPIVKDIFLRYSKGEMVADIIRDLNSKGYRTSLGREFNKNSLNRILTNKKYIGTYVYKGVETPNAIPRIISDELFREVQIIMDKNKKAPARQRAFTEYLLTTKLFCGYCKEMMTGYSAKKKYNYYGCKSVKQHKCKKTAISKDYIEDLIVNATKEFLNNQKNIDIITKEIEAIAVRERNDRGINELKKQLKAENTKKANLLTALSECNDESIRQEIYPKINEIKAIIERIEVDITKIEAPFDTLLFDKVKFIIQELKNGNIADIKFKKLIINMFISEIYLYDDRVVIVFITSKKKSVKLDKDVLKKAESLCLDSSAPPFVYNPFI